MQERILFSTSASLLIFFYIIKIEFSLPLYMGAMVQICCSNLVLPFPDSNRLATFSCVLAFCFFFPLFLLTASHAPQR